MGDKSENQRSTLESASSTAADQALNSDEIRRLVRRKARRLIERGGLSLSEQPDIEQSLFLSLLKAWQSYGADRGNRLPFAERVLQNASKVLLRDQFALRRDYRNTILLSLLVHTDEGSKELSQLIGSKEADARFGANRRAEQDERELALDVGQFIEQLPSQFRELARALEQETVLEISRRTRIPRSTIYNRKTLLRKAAEDAGLNKYLR